ncbi:MULTISPECIES: sulfite exporter TauE/SafE family protein [Dyadobacter]|uniref:Probable membrane transporter protein n=1 Tax=Dyadobacter psychrotolerans TaxID=2541721 RepID=A0A4R5DQG2_9BACT|nr:sulfite exporter TauE/SafE family protein [Dyadobacter psychrotolerans]TDE13245.1 sulfite exporter TauE/SafE family protein [Dyadobacter psychrotolerans]
MFFSELFLFLSSIFAFSVSVVCGGGAGLLLIPILKSMVPAAQVPAALSIGTASSSLSRIAIFRSHIDWKIVARFVPPALPAVWLGAWLLKFINPLYLELILGLFLVGNLPTLLKKGIVSEESDSLPVIYLSLIGLAAGFVSGLTGAVGLLFNRFYLRSGLSKEQIVATRAANEILLHIIKLALYASFGLLTIKAIGFGALIAVAALGSSWIMKWLLPKISPSFFKRIGYAAMVISGLSLFGGAASRLVQDNGAGISLTPVSGGIETQLQWRQGYFALEFQYDEGIEFENKIGMNELPIEKQIIARKLIRGADKFILEEVFGISKHYYEVYIIRKGKLEKFDI